MPELRTHTKYFLLCCTPTQGTYEESMRTATASLTGAIHSLYQGALYFENVTRFRGTLLNVIISGCSLL